MEKKSFEEIDKGKILILMATYNGEKYLIDQLESIVAQTYKNWHLLISDDASKDNTIKIIDSYSKKYKNIEYMSHEPQNGALGNFNFLINKSKEMNYPYIMFCDQDDYWLETKIEDTFNEVKKNEIFGKPLLIYTDRELVDEKLRSLNYCTKKMKQFFFKRALHQNTIYGCTMLINKSLLNILTRNIPFYFENHDHYISLIALLEGKIIFLDKKTILYRQHGNNVSGDIRRGIIKKIADRKKYRKNIESFFYISKFVRENYFEQLSEEEKIIINSINTNIVNGGMKGVFYLMKNRIWNVSVKGTLRMMVEIFLHRRQEGDKNR